CRLAVYCRRCSYQAQKALSGCSMIWFYRVLAVLGGLIFGIVELIKHFNIVRDFIKNHSVAFWVGAAAVVFLLLAYIVIRLILNSDLLSSIFALIGKGVYAYTESRVSKSRNQRFLEEERRKQEEKLREQFEEKLDEELRRLEEEKTQYRRLAEETREQEKVARFRAMHLRQLLQASDGSSSHREEKGYTQYRKAVDEAKELEEKVQYLERQVQFFENEARQLVDRMYRCREVNLLHYSDMHFRIDADNTIYWKDGTKTTLSQEGGTQSDDTKTPSEPITAIEFEKLIAEYTEKMQAAAVNEDKPTDILDMMKKDTEETTEHFRISKGEAKKSFNTALVCLALGFPLIMFAVIWGIVSNNITPTIISAIGGVITEFIAGTALLVRKQSLNQLNHFYDMLRRNQDILVSVNMVEKMSDDSRDEMYKEIIKRLMSNTVVPSTT
ncbi:MAG: hypothetical protein FWC27_03010, partial [Firmicutes bacterium]|nr:hypothetical protein [Bacillota bacterium]